MESIVTSFKRRATILHFVPLKQYTTELPKFALSTISDCATVQAGETKEDDCHLIFERSGDFVYATQCSLRHFRHVSLSSSVAEILAPTYALSDGLYVIELLQSFK